MLKRLISPFAALVASVAYNAGKQAGMEPQPLQSLQGLEVSVQWMEKTPQGHYLAMVRVVETQALRIVYSDNRIHGRFVV